MDSETEQVSLDAMQKENKELKAEIRMKNQARKVSDFLLSVAGGVAIYWIFMIICQFAVIGIQTIANSGELSPFGLSMCVLFFNIGQIAVIAYIAWHVLVVNVWNFSEEILIAEKKLKVYVKAGRAAVEKNREKIEKEVLEEDKTEYTTVQKQL